jgi:hypothetical protein
MQATAAAVSSGPFPNRSAMKTRVFDRYARGEISLEQVPSEIANSTSSSVGSKSARAWLIAGLLILVALILLPASARRN